MLLAGDADVADGDKDSDDDDGDGGCESDLGPCHHPGPRPIVIQWAGRVVVGKTLMTAREEVETTGESDSNHRRPHCQRPGTHAPPAHNTLPPLFFLSKSAAFESGNLLLITITVK
jgi:hypothetical protein